MFLVRGWLNFGRSTKPIVMKALSLPQANQQKVLGLSKSLLSKDYLFVKTTQAVHVIEKKSISHLQAQGNYTLIYAEGRKICSSKTLKHFDKILQGRSFLRTHQSYIVNISHIDQFFYGSSSEIKLLSGDSIPVSRSKKSMILSSFVN